MALKRVFSAGGIIVKNDGDGPKILVTQHSKHKGWDFPKGHREIYETDEQAALREVEEETGIKAQILEKIGQTQYFYFEEGHKVLKTAVFYLMRYVTEGEATTAFEVSDMKWLAPDKVVTQLTFKDTKELWKKARAMIESLS